MCVIERERERERERLWSVSYSLMLTTGRCMCVYERDCFVCVYVCVCVCGWMGGWVGWCVCVCVCVIDFFFINAHNWLVCVYVCVYVKKRFLRSLLLRCPQLANLFVSERFLIMSIYVCGREIFGLRARACVCECLCVCV